MMAEWLWLLLIETAEWRMEWLTRIGLASLLVNGFKFLGAEGSRDAGSGAADAGQSSLLEALPTAGFGLTRLPWWRLPGKEGVAIGHPTRLQVGRTLRRVAAQRHRFRIDPRVAVDPVTGHSTVLDSLKFIPIMIILLLMNPKSS